MGVRCWYAPEDMKIGDKIRARIDDSIRMYDKLLIILSRYSIASDWAEKEVETAFEKERQQNKTVLFPIRLDDWGATRSRRCSCKNSRKEDLTWGSAPKCPTRLNQVRLGQRSRVR